MAMVRCEISDGFRPSEANVGIADVNQRRQYLRLEQHLLTQSGDQWYMTIGVVQVDPRTSAVLIELPHEADSGANRLWVRKSDLLQRKGELD